MSPTSVLLCELSWRVKLGGRHDARHIAGCIPKATPGEAGAIFGICSNNSVLTTDLRILLF
jgi:hypothetical protein